MGVLDKIMLEHSAIYSIEQSLPFNLSSFIVHNGGATLPIFNGQRTGNDHEYAHLNEEFDDIFPPEDDLPAVSIIDDEENPSVGTPLVNGLINDNNQSNQPSTPLLNGLINDSNQSSTPLLNGLINDTNRPTTPLLNGLINDSNQSSTPLLNGLINDTNRPTTPLLDGLINNSNQGEQINNNSTENAKTTN
ncbi:hypothetical protein BCR32DRAFT_246934 [Anaeromyces robustus]|uniref:Uncharacterized protein n=1 Tax=Anaeromyces robustus TaxID=1754192 RepID=A0A1Y1WZ29_9FUNG|nr:hypothetical protein BCR32DRAFT_246934 [Anaeromyces robustus]|eukprot:ORX78763.1 hypothetical protein BCR32DRAFT_246934 [Anaeromyces robustus]